MERPAMHSTYRHLLRGTTAAAMLVGALAPRAASQAGDRGGSRAGGPGDRDFIFRQILPPGVGIDSVRTLIRALQGEAFRSRGWLGLKAKLDSLLPVGLLGVPMLAGGGLRPPPIKGWIGINAGGVPYHEMIGEAGDVVRYLMYPPIISVDPDSPAQHAGIEPGDVLVAYDGMDVVDHDVNLTRLLIPEKRLVVTVRHEGETKDYPMQIARMSEKVWRRNRELSEPLPPALAFGRPDDRDMTRRFEFPKPLIIQRDDGGGMVMAAPPGFFVLAGDGLFGARLSTVRANLARALKIKIGVLVTDVSDGTPAARAGLRAGDVIVAAAGQPVTTMDRLQRVLANRLHDQSIDLQVVRDNKTRTITVTW